MILGYTKYQSRFSENIVIRMIPWIFPILISVYLLTNTVWEFNSILSLQDWLRIKEPFPMVQRKPKPPTNISTQSRSYFSYSFKDVN